MLKDLTWENYLELNYELINNSYENVFYTPVQLVQWLEYNIKIKYHQIDNCILVYILHSENDEWMVFNPFYKKPFNQELAFNIMKEDLKLLNTNNEHMYLVSFCSKTINDWNLNEYENEKYNFVSNYIYELNQLKTFAGNKMQKKRNHLNFFLKQAYDIEIKNIKDVDKDLIISFTKDIIKKYDDEVREHEVKSYVKTLNDINKDKNYSGIVLYINQQIVAYTLGFLNNDTYEIIIEKAERDIKELFQYLIKTNLEYNNINAKYIDRLDDLGLPALKKSKMSYCPINVVERFNINLSKKINTFENN